MAERKFKKHPKIMVVDLDKPVPAEIFMREMCRKSEMTLAAQVGLTIQEQADYIAREVAAHDYVFAIHQEPHSPVLKWVKGYEAAMAKGGMNFISPEKGTAFFMPNSDMADTFIVVHGQGVFADMLRAEHRRDMDKDELASHLTLGRELITRNVIEHFFGPQTGPVTDPV